MKFWLLRPSWAGLSVLWQAMRKAWAVPQRPCSALEMAQMCLLWTSFQLTHFPSSGVGILSHVVLE